MRGSGKKIPTLITTKSGMNKNCPGYITELSMIGRNVEYVYSRNRILEAR